MQLSVCRQLRTATAVQVEGLYVDCVTCMPRRSWDLAFLAEPAEVAILRRALRMNLAAWGLQELSDPAQVCVSELVSNVINHVGPETPTTLAVSMLGSHLRIEIHDPDTRALPTLVDAHADVETGRGMALVDALADRWGIHLLADRKVTWCEFATGSSMPSAAQTMRFEAECDASRERPRRVTRPRSQSTSTRPPESGASAAM